MKVRFRIPEATDPRREGGMQLPPQQARRIPPRWRWIVIVLLALSPALLVAGMLLHGWLWLDAGGFVVLDETRVTARRAATVRAVHVENGRAVEAGALLLEMADGELSAELEALGPVAGAGAPEQAALQRQIAAAEARLEAERRQAATVEELHAGGAATRGEVLAAIARASAAEVELAGLERERARQREGASALAAGTRERASRRAILAARQRDLRVVAPASGVVDALAASAGQTVAAGEELLVLRHGEPRVIGFLEGRELHLRPGARVRIVLPDGKTIPGDVVGLAPSTLRLPDELSGSFDQRSPRLQVAIAPIGLPPEARVHRLPVTVRIFRFRR